MSDSEAPAGTSAAKEWARRLALMVLSPLLFLVAVEFVLWTFDVAPPPDPQQEGRKKTIEGFDPDAREQQLTGAEGPRVACLGGSSIAGMPLDYKLSMCTMVAESIDRDTDVIQDSGRGFDTADLMHRVAVTCRFKHTLVLIYSGHNEFINLWRFHEDTPEAARALTVFLGNFRFFRLLQSWFEPEKPEHHIGELGKASVSDEKVFQRYDRNLRAMVEQCGKNSPVILSTIVSNRGFQFPMPSMTARESVQANRAGQRPRPDEVLFRARPRINKIIRQVAADTGVALVDAEALIADKNPADMFWDGVHPKPALHLLLATEMLRLAKARGYVQHTTPPRISVSRSDIDAAAEVAAFEAMGVDPVFVLKMLKAIESPVNPIGVALGIGLTGFMADDRSAMRAGFAQAVELFKDDRYRRVFSACAGLTPGRDGQTKPERRGGCGLRCLPFPCTKDFMSDSERGELTATARKLGDPLLTAVIGQL